MMYKLLPGVLPCVALRRALTALLALVFAALPVSAFAMDQADSPVAAEVLILYEESSTATIEPRVMAVCDIFTYMSKSYNCLPISETISIEGYGCIVLISGSRAHIPEDLAERLQTAQIPVMLIGGSALLELGIGADVYSGWLNARYDFYGDSVVRWEIGYADVYIPQRYDGDFGGVITANGDQEVPLCARVGHISSVAWFDPAYPTMIPALASILTDWMWPFRNRPHSYSGYLVVDQVYPIADLEHMMRVTDMLIEENVPYAICVMPIYDNGHFPAMKRFCEYLRYAQSRGAAIILRTPIVSLATTDPVEIRARMALAYETYIQYGVYPLAIEAPKAYMYTEEGLSILRGSRTVLLFESDDVIPEIPDINASFKDGHYIIAPAYTYSTHIYGSAFSSAVYLDSGKDVETLRSEVRSFKESSVSLRSLWSLSNALYMTTDDYFFVKNNVSFLNGERLDLTYKPFQYDDSADFSRGFMRYLTEQLEASNRVIIAIVALSVLVSGALILHARRRTRREFFIKASPSEERDRGVGL